MSLLTMFRSYYVKFYLSIHVTYRKKKQSQFAESLRNGYLKGGRIMGNSDFLL